jgi:hypothetical protein
MDNLCRQGYADNRIQQLSCGCKWAVSLTAPTLMGWEGAECKC